MECSNALKKKKKLKKEKKKKKGAGTVLFLKGCKRKGLHLSER